VRIVSLNTGGLVVYGALLLGGIALLTFIYKHHVPGLALADLIAPSVVIGLGIGRLGCFLNGCCFGGLCDLPWAVTFPKDSPPYQHQVVTGQMHGLVIAAGAEHMPVIADVQPNTPAAGAGLHAGETIKSINGQTVATLDEAQRALARTFDDGKNLELGTADGVYRLRPLVGTAERSRPVHPAQLYSAIDALLLCLFLIAYYPFRRRDGEVAALTLTLHPLSRFLLEIIRTDEAPVFGTGLSISQNISVAIFAGAIVLWIYLARQPRGTAWPARTA
jgi:phosphatidylglycerol:prolipoprotein diacylglycerol transferase